MELGGKNPCIIDKTAPIRITSKRIVWGKFLNCGQTCIAPDYLLVHEKIKDQLTQELIFQIEKAYGKNQQDSPDYGRIAHQNHFNKLKASLANQNVIYGGNTDEKDFFGPTLVDNPNLDSELMKEEIFEFCLLLLSSEEMIHKLLENEAPLSLLCFF